MALSAIRLQFEADDPGNARNTSASPRPRSRAWLRRRFRGSAIYSDVTRSLAITFAAPLASRQAVRVELLEGIVGANGRLLEPWRCSTGD